MIEDNWLKVGDLVAPHGVKGDIKVRPCSDFPERFINPGKRWLKNQTEQLPQEAELVGGKQIPGKDIYIISFKGITNRESAKSLIGKEMLVPINDRPFLKNDEFHLLDLVGLEARLGNSKIHCGHVTNLISGGNDLLEIELSEGKRVLVPFVKEIVPEIKLKEKWLRITPPPGLLEL